MRILATGDTQIGATTVTLESQAQVLDRIADAAIENGADLVLHGGDVFEGPQITPEHLAVFRRFVARLRDARIPVVAITGNGTHDRAMREVHGLDIFEDIPGITICSRPMNVTLAGVTVSCLPWVSEANLAAQHNGGSREALHEHASRMLLRIARELREQASDAPTILLAHHSISSASLPTGLPTDQMGGTILEWADLDAIGFDAIVAAHIHKAQRLDDPALGDTTPGVYVGSPQPLNHGEGGYEHGVWLIDTLREPGGAHVASAASAPGSLSVEFLPIEAPQFLTYDLGFPIGSDHLERIPLLGIEDAIVRVRYTATREQDATIDKDAIRRELLAAGASRVTIEPSITREVRARDERMTQELSDLDALALYCEAQGYELRMTEQMVVRLKEWSES